MNRLFNPENKFWNFVAKLADVACMSILWLICSLPLITLGASTAGFFSFTMRQVDDTEGSVWKSFFSGFKKHFKKATVIWLVQLAGIAFLVYDLYAAWQYFTISSSVVSLFFLSFCACITLLFLGTMQYIYPLLTTFDFGLGKLFKDSFIMSVANLHVTVTMHVLFVLLFIAFYYLSGLFFFWIGLYIFFSSYFITGVFKKYTGEIAVSEGLITRWKERHR